jgi:CysZ protein
MLQLFKGAGDVARGCGVLFAHPRFLVWLIAPAVATLLVIAGVIWGVLALSDPAVAWVAVRLPDWMAGWVSGLLRFLVIGGLAIAGFLVFVTVAGLLAGPFCEILSEAVEEQVTGRPAPGFSLSGFVRGLVAGVIHAIRRLLVYLFTLVLVLILSAIIPVIGPLLAIALGAYFAASSAAYDCFDAVLARRLWPYRKKLEYLRAHRGRTLGVGATTTVLFLVPVVNLFALGLGATGATLAFLDLEDRQAGRPGQVGRAQAL